MNIDEMSDRDKSVLLVKAMRCYAFEQVFSDGRTQHNMTMNGHIQPLVNLYDPANMVLLARVIEWANSEHISYSAIDSADIHGSMCQAADEILAASGVLTPPQTNEVDPGG